MDRDCPRRCSLLGTTTDDLCRLHPLVVGLGNAIGCIGNAGWNSWEVPMACGAGTHEAKGKEAYEEDEEGDQLLKVRREDHQCMISVFS